MDPIIPKSEKVAGHNINYETGEVEETALPYFKQRLLAAGIPDEYNKFIAIDPLREFPMSRNIAVPIFAQDDKEKDNMYITYMAPSGTLYWYDNGNKNNSAKIYHRTRLKNPRVYFKDGKEESQKYDQPKGSPIFPFFTKGVIEKYKAGEEILDLFLVEGELKAAKGDYEGLDIIGIPSIHGFYSGEVKGKLHEDIQELITKCKIKNIILLQDADAQTITYERGKDLSKRPTLFYSAVKNFRESLQLLLENKAIPLENAYFMHPHRKFCAEGSKGLDDLLTIQAQFKAEILEDLKQKQFARKYFQCISITDTNLNKLQKHFGISREEGAEQLFYELYKEFIGNREFIYKKRKYEIDAEGKVVFQAHEDAEKFLRIGPDWIKIVGVPNKYGELEEQLVPWKIGEITRDYCKKWPFFLDDVPKFDSFCVVPQWNGKYQRVHNGCYNLYSPLLHVPTPGDFPATKKFLKHIFQGQGDFENDIIGDQFTVALDYLTIQYQNPMQMLPVPCLVSPENRTGKSTVLKWLQQIYGNNACILGNDQFKMKFNSHYITKFIIGIDEGFLDVDKKAEKERLKQLATADTVYMEDKGMNVKKIPYYGKLIISSNDADKVMKMEEGESRWFVIRVPRIGDDEVDPDLEEKLKAEIPAWLHYLKNRAIAHPKADRLWFKPEWFITEQFKKIVEATKNRLDYAIEDYMREKFLTFKQPVLRLSLKHLLRDLNESSKYKIDEKDVKYYLKEKRNMEAGKVQRIAIPVAIDTEMIGTDGLPTITYVYDCQRPYIFKYEEWLNKAEQEEFLQPFENEKKEEPDYFASAHGAQGNFDLSAKAYYGNRP